MSKKPKKPIDTDKLVVWFCYIGMAVIVIMMIGLVVTYDTWSPKFQREWLGENAIEFWTPAPTATPEPTEIPAPTVEPAEPTAVPGQDTSNEEPSAGPEMTTTPALVETPSTEPEETPALTKIPEEMAETTETPAATDIPEPTTGTTVSPAVTEPPVATEIPQETPEPTELPAATEVPEATPLPTVTPTTAPTATPEPEPTATPELEEETTEPYFGTDGYSYAGDKILFYGEEVRMDSLNVKFCELAVHNITAAPNHEKPRYRTTDNKGILVRLSCSDESVVVVKLSGKSSEIEQGYVKDRGTPEIQLIPVSTGTATVTATLHTVDLNGENVSEAVDTYTFTVIVEEYTTKTEVNLDEYNPAAEGYPELAGEWQCGDDIYASLWWDGEEEGDAVLVLTGTGAMWNVEEKKKHTGSAYWGWDYTSECFDYTIVEVYFGEGITRTESTSCIDAEVITLPSTLKVIGESSFSWSYIREIELPEGLERIERGAFGVCENLESIVLPSTLKYIGDFAFDLSEAPEEDSINLVTEVVIPESVEYIGCSPFWYRWGLQIVLPEGMDTSNWNREWAECDGFELAVTYR